MRICKRYLQIKLYNAGVHFVCYVYTYIISVYIFVKLIQVDTYHMYQLESIPTLL